MLLESSIFGVVFAIFVIGSLVVNAIKKHAEERQAEQQRANRRQPRRSRPSFHSEEEQDYANQAQGYDYEEVVDEEYVANYGVESVEEPDSPVETLTSYENRDHGAESMSHLVHSGWRKAVIVSELLAPPVSRYRGRYPWQRSTRKS